MRVTDAISSRNILQNIAMLNERLERASEQASSGKKLLQLHDSPSASAEMVQLGQQMAQIDQYQTNAESGGFFLNVTDSTLNSLYNLVTSVYTRGSAAANSSNDAGTLAALAGEIQSQRDQIFSLANTQVRGRYIFAGANVAAPAYTIAGDTVTYQGDAEVNKLDIGNGLQVQENVPGSSVFDPVFTSVTALLTAVQGGDQNAIKSALGQFSGALSTLNQARARLGVDLGKLQDAAATRQDLQANIKARQSTISDADMAEAIAGINRTQTALQATLNIGSLLGKKNLMDYLG
jgi:flagellar hook-associated protein 3 FlgL